MPLQGLGTVDIYHCNRLWPPPPHREAPAGKLGQPLVLSGMVFAGAGQNFWSSLFQGEWKVLSSWVCAVSSQGLVGFIGASWTAPSEAI